MKNKDERKELKIVRTLLNKLNDSINYCHWKSNEHFANALIGIDDLDILIDRTQYNEVIKILCDLNFKHFYIPNARTYVGIEDYLGFDEETGIIIHLHLHSRLVIGEKHLKGFLFPIEEYVLDNRYFNNEYQVYHSSHFDEMILLILRSGMKVRKRDAFKRNFVGKSTQSEFDWLKDNTQNFNEQLEKTDFLTDKTKKYVSIIYNKGLCFNACNKLKHNLYSEYRFYTQGSGVYNTFKRTFREFCRIILEIQKRYLKSKRIFTRRRLATGGTIISFVGSDGAGKSTVIKEIYNWLFQMMDVRYFYLGSGDGDSSLPRKVLKAVMKIAQDLNIIKKSNNFNDSSLKPQNTNKFSFAKKIWTYFLSVERIKKLRQLSICRNFGYVVLTDRYPQSQFYGLCDGKKLNDKSIAAKKEAEAFRIAQMCPPDIAIKMIVDPSIAVSRKPGEIDIETSKNLTNRIKSINYSKHTKNIIIDSNLPKEEVIINIKREIWKNL